MPIDVTETLRQALSKLEAERTRIDRQIAAVRTVLGATGSRNSSRSRKALSAAARKAISQRMKAYWAKRRMKAK
ncbi:MAG: hypothetical protein HY678_10660 [Chloroflexi bacterium]|nr:hypothetical protein [Chloroflexota bacterium]